MNSHSLLQDKLSLSHTLHTTQALTTLTMLKYIKYTSDVNMVYNNLYCQIQQSKHKERTYPKYAQLLWHTTLLQFMHLLEKHMQNLHPALISTSFAIQKSN